MVSSRDFTCTAVESRHSCKSIGRSPNMLGMTSQSIATSVAPTKSGQRFGDNHIEIDARNTVSSFGSVTITSTGSA